MSVSQIKPVECKDEIQNFKLIDVRREDEYTGELGHIEGAKLITIGEDFIQQLSQYGKNDKILFICRSGRRSEMACLQAMESGYDNVHNLDGGMIAWNECGLPVKA